MPFSTLEPTRTTSLEAVSHPESTDPKDADNACTSPLALADTEQVGPPPGHQSGGESPPLQAAAMATGAELAGMYMGIYKHSAHVYDCIR